MNKINEIQDNLKMLSEYLSTCKENSKFFDIYVDVRSGYLLKYVQDIYKETKDQNLTQYQPGSTKYIDYTRALLKIIKVTVIFFFFFFYFKFIFLLSYSY